MRLVEADVQRDPRLDPAVVLPCQLPLGAAIYNKKVAEVIVAAHGGPQTGHTFTGHTACCAAGVAVQKMAAQGTEVIIGGIMVVAGIAVGPETRYQLDAALARKHWGPKTRMAMIASPANPTGTLVTPSETKALAALARE